MPKFLRVGNQTVNLDHVTRTNYEPSKKRSDDRVVPASFTIYLTEIDQGETASYSDSVTFTGDEAEWLDSYFSRHNRSGLVEDLNHWIAKFEQE